MRLEWPTEFLKSGVILTDLPGVGVVGDRFPEVTKKWMLHKSRSVVFVTDNSGIDETSAKVLRESGFIQRLLLEKNDPTLDPIELIIAVTQMDRLLNDKQVDTPEEAELIFGEICNRMVLHIKNQLKTFFETIVEDETRESIKNAKSEDLFALLEKVQVVPLSANEFIKLSTRHKSSQFSKAEVTNIPLLREGVETRAIDYKSKYENKIARLLHQVETDARASQEAAESEIKNLEVALNNNNIMNNYQQSFKPALMTVEQKGLGYIKDTNLEVQKNIKKFMENILNDALQKISYYCDSDLRHAHWSTLKAALKRGGSYSGAKHIDIPQSTVDVIIERVAVSFTPLILSQIAKKMDEVTSDYQQEIIRTLDWILTQDIPVEKRRHFALRLKNYKTANQYAKDQLEKELNKLTEKIRILITTDVSDGIKNSSSTFIKSSESSGLGVKARMVESVRKMMTEVINDSCKTIEKFIVSETLEGVVMQQCYSMVNLQIAEIRALESELDAEARKQEAERKERIMKDVGPYIDKFKQLEFQAKELKKTS